MQAKKRTLKVPTKTGKISRGEIRAAIRAVHVMPKPETGWEVRKMGEGRFTHQFPSKRDAVAFARSVGKQGRAELIIHGREGKRTVGRSRLARACAKLDPAFEKALAEESMSEDVSKWPEY